MKPDFINIIDLFVLPFTVILILGVAKIIHRQYKDSIVQKYFFPALYLRFLGAISIGCMYEYYYRSGDTWGYYILAKIVTKMFYAGDWQLLLELLFGPTNLGYSFQTMDYLQNVDEFSRIYTNTYPYGTSTRVSSSIFGIINIFTFNSYLSIGVWGSFLSFMGCWFIYLGFFKHYPQLNQSLALFTLFLPSLFFWGSILGKEPFLILGLGIFTYGLFSLVRGGGNFFYHLALILIGGWLMYIIKPYVIFATLPAIVVLINTSLRLPLPSPWDSLAKIFLTILIIPASLTVITTFGNINEKYSFDKATKIAGAFQQEQIAVAGGSSYNIGELDLSPTGMPIYMIKAVNVTLFRPYIWEVRNFNQLIAFIESFTIVFLTIYLIYNIGLFKIIKQIFTTPITLYSVVFTVILGFIIGSTAFNFGTLVRYRIPCLPFYLSSLAIIYFNVTNKELIQF